MTEQLLLKPAEAAKALAICERTLRELTNTNHAQRMPCVRIGKAVRYDPADLRAWVEDQKTGTLAS